MPAVLLAQSDEIVRDPDELVPDTFLYKNEFKVTSMTFYRWTNDDELNFPPPIKIRNRNYRSRRQIEEFKARLFQHAMANRSKSA
jgi:hypothetical protein